MPHIGKYSRVCMHGEEDGKCEYCFDEYQRTGIRSETRVYKDILDERETKNKPVDEISVVEQVRRDLVEQFMARSDRRHRND